jgi:hypothetical protein
MSDTFHVCFTFEIHDQIFWSRCLIILKYMLDMVLCVFLLLIIPFVHVATFKFLDALNLLDLYACQVLEAWVVWLHACRGLLRLASWL